MYLPPRLWRGGSGAARQSSVDTAEKRAFIIKSFLIIHNSALLEIIMPLRNVVSVLLPLFKSHGVLLAARVPLKSPYRLLLGFPFAHSRSRMSDIT